MSFFLAGEGEGGKRKRDERSGCGDGMGWDGKGREGKRSKG